MGQRRHLPRAVFFRRALALSLALSFLALTGCVNDGMQLPFFDNAYEGGLGKTPAGMGYRVPGQ